MNVLQDGDHVQVVEEHAGEGAEARDAAEEMPVHRRQIAKPEKAEERFTNAVIFGLLTRLSSILLE